MDRYYAAIAALMVLVVATTATAATLTTNAPVLLGSALGMKMSVYPGKSAYQGSVSGVFGDGTIIDYRLYNNETLATGGYVDGGGGRVGEVTASGDLTDYSMDYTDVWTLTDPGIPTGGIPDFSSTADFAGVKTMAGPEIVDGTVDVSGLVTGIVYVLCGSYDSVFTVTATLSGSGQPTITNSFSIDPAASRNTYILGFGFDDPNDDYDTISYNYTGSHGTRARFMGVIFEGAVAPGQLLWTVPLTSTITTNQAAISAIVDNDLTACTLVWDTSDQGATNIGDWAESTSLGAFSAGPVSGQITGLTPDTSYTWRLYGIGAAASGWSGPITFASSLSDAQAPVFTNASVQDGTLQVALGWEDKANTETAYILQRSSNGTDFDVIDAAIAADTVSYVDVVPTPGNYWYRLQAANEDNGSSTVAALCETSIEVLTPAIYSQPGVLISSGTDFNLSVHLGKARYAGTGAYSGESGIFGDGKVEAYYFLTNGVSPTLSRYAHDGSEILDFPSNNTFTTFSDFDLADVWIANDPGTDFSDGDPADFGGTTATISGGYLVNGNVDVSDFLNGTVYVLCGSYINPFAVTATISGSGVSDVVATTGSITPPTSRNIYVIAFPFDCLGKNYTNIYYAYTGSAGNRSRFMGVIVDGNEPPSGTVIVIR